MLMSFTAMEAHIFFSYSNAIRYHLNNYFVNLINTHQKRGNLVGQF